MFLRLFPSHKMHLLDLFGPFYRQKWQISLPFHILQILKSLPFHIPEAWIPGELPSKGHYKEYPPARTVEILINIDWILPNAPLSCYFIVCMVQWTNCFDVVPSGSSFKGIRELTTAILGMRTLTGVGLGGGAGGRSLLSIFVYKLAYCPYFGKTRFRCLCPPTTNFYCSNFL